MRRKRLLIAASGMVCFVVVGFLLRPSRMPNPLFRKVVARNGSPYSGTWEETFEVEDPIPRFRVQTNLQGHAADLRIDLERRDGLQFLHGFPIERGFTCFSCGNGARGVYTIRVREDHVTGKYSIEIGGRAGVTRWQKLLVLLVALFAVSGILYFRQRRRIRVGRSAPALAGSRFAFLAIGLGLFVLFFYLLLHEGGHALAAIAFGSFDLSRSDFIGLYGNPHSGVNPEVALADWQKAIQSIAGPLLPILVGYVLIAFWRSRWGTVARGRNVLLDIFWSFTIFTILVSSLGLLIPIIRLSPDGDYSGFVNFIPLARWQADALLLTIVSINVYLLCRIIPHLVKLRRRLIVQASPGSV